MATAGGASRTHTDRGARGASAQGGAARPTGHGSIENPAHTGPIRTLADVEAVERAGLDAFLPAPTPYALIERAAALWGERTALHYLPAVDAPERDVRLTYADLLRRVRQTANALHLIGVHENDTVALLLPHTADAQIAL